LTGLLITSLKQRLSSFTLVPSRGGCFEIEVDGELIYSKLATRVFPDPAVILDTVTAMLKAASR